MIFRRATTVVGVSRDTPGMYGQTLKIGDEKDAKKRREKKTRKKDAKERGEKKKQKKDAKKRREKRRKRRCKKRHKKRHTRRRKIRCKKRPPSITPDYSQLLTINP